MVYKKTEYPPWSWSSSRKSVFNECLRKYFYNYYLAHNGWEDSAPEEARQAYRLKKLSGLHLLLGTAVHEAAEYIWKKIKADKNYVPTEQEIFENNIKEKIGKALKDSKELISDDELIKKWQRNPKSYTFLCEYYYAKGKNAGEKKKNIVRNIGSKIQDKRKAVVKHLISSISIEELRKADPAAVLTENMDTFDICDDDNDITPVYAIPDLVYEGESGERIIVDWKTGKEAAEHKDQVSIYAKYFNQKDQTDFNNIKGRIEYLIDGKAVEIEVSEKSVDETCEMIRKSIKEMKNLIVDGKIAGNQPEDMDRFPLTKVKKFCPWCSFYEMCKEKL